MLPNGALECATCGVVAPDVGNLMHFECKPAPEKSGYELVQKQVQHERRLAQLQQLQQLQQQLEMLQTLRAQEQSLMGQFASGPDLNQAARSLWQAVLFNGRRHVAEGGHPCTVHGGNVCDLAVIGAQPDRRSWSEKRAGRRWWMKPATVCCNAVGS